MITATGGKVAASSTKSSAANSSRGFASALASPYPFLRQFAGPMGAALKQRFALIPPLAWLLLLMVVCLAPFVGKAFFIDDTLFLRVAEQIQKHPLNFYGFSINWYGYVTPMPAAFDNPPLTSYYLALVASVFGWHERALHLAFLLPALAAVWGVFALAKNYCERPFTAALIALLTPVFLISATSIMCDVSQLAFWVWSLVFFEEGLRTERRSPFVTSGILAGLAFLTKYLGLSLVPLLLAYGLCRKRRAGWWLVAPMIPLLFAAGYEWLTARLYGQGLLLAAAHDAAKLRATAYCIPWEKANIGLSFVGACFLPVLLYAPWLWTRRILLAIPCLMAAGLLIIPRVTAYLPFLWKADGHLAWGMFVYIATLVVAGLYVFLLAAMDLWERRDAVSVLLLLWLSGVFVFAVALNWTIDGRSLLPAVPAVGILAARRLDQRYPPFRQPRRGQFLWPALLATAISLWLVNADCAQGNSQRAAARELGAQFQSAGNTTWFYEHSGFQYYIGPFGAKVMDIKSPKLAAGNIVMAPLNANDPFSNSPDKFRLIETKKIIGSAYLSTFDSAAGAGFYSIEVGPLPFAIGNIRPQRIKVYRVVQRPDSAEVTRR
jgi:4-amino-4-deoxy-L-arabinose transferase-like glycosyltransferase